MLHTSSAISSYTTRVRRITVKYNHKEGRLPFVWKLANVCPIPKSKQVLNVNNDLRPISLTSTLCEIAEEFVIARDLKSTLMNEMY